MRVGGVVGWATGLVAALVAVICCALGTAVVAGAVLAVGAGLLAGSGLIALLALAFVAAMSVAALRRRARCR